MIARDSHQSHSIGGQLSLEFGGMAALNNLSELEEARATLLSPLLEFEYSKTDCSQLTRHMWAHVKDKDFATKAEFILGYTTIGKSKLYTKVQSSQIWKPQVQKNALFVCKRELFYLWHATRKGLQLTILWIARMKYMWIATAAERDSYGYLPLGMRVLMRILISRKQQ